MFRILFLMLLTVPILEIYLLIQVGGQVGTLTTISLVVATAILGIGLVRREGVRTIVALNQRLEQGELPAIEVVEGAMLLVAGALLLTPGFFTDGVGFLFAFPWTRVWLRRGLMGLIKQKAAMALTPAPGVVEGECWQENKNLKSLLK